jgi:hypothetical protein
MKGAAGMKKADGCELVIRYPQSMPRQVPAIMTKR